MAVLSEKLGSGSRTRGVDGKDLVTENIDERILRILRLEDIFDIDYDTYISLLKEQLVLSSTGKQKISRDEEILIQDEYKKVKRKKGRFIVKKITAENFNKVISTPASGVYKSQVIKNILPPAEDQKQLLASKVSKTSKSLEDSIENLSKIFSSILDTLKKQLKLNESEKEYDRKKEERDRRSATESKLEKRFEGLKKVAEKIIAPVKSLLDRILEFFTTILLGRVVYKFIDWLGDPENASKIKSIIRFMKDWWPALLGSYILFGTSFGRFTRSILGIASRFIFQIGKVAIPQLLKFIRTPLGAGLALFGAGAAIPAIFPKSVNEQERKISSAPGSKEEKIRSLEQQKANLNFFEKLQGKGSEIDEQINYLKTGQTKSYGFSGGGFSGFISGEKGVDKIPAMLSDGEFVMSRGAVQMYGVDTLEAMNSAGGGTNKPKIVSGIPHAATGGLIGQNPGNERYNPLQQIDRLFDRIFGANIDLKNQSTWPPLGSLNPLYNQNMMPKNIDVGKRLNYEVNRMSDSLPNLSKSSFKLGKYDIGKRLRYETNRMTGLLNKKASVPQFGGKGRYTKDDKGDILSGLKRKQYREAGTVFARSILGGIGGKITENDFSSESRAILEQAIKRAESRQNQKIAKARDELSKDPNNEQKKSALNRLMMGQIRLEYGDYASKLKVNPKTGEYVPVYTSAEDDLKNILGQSWFVKQKGGGYKTTNEKYDFQQYKDPLRVLLGDASRENKDVKKSGVNFQKRLEAFHQIMKNAGIAKDLGVDVLIGKQRPKDSPNNMKALESKRPWWDKMGFFGGASAGIENERKRRSNFLKSNPGATIYNKPKPLSKDTPYKSRFARPKSAGLKPVSPPPKGNVTIYKPSGGGQGGGRSSRKSLSSPKTPNFSATSPSGTNAKKKILAITS